MYLSSYPQPLVLIQAVASCTRFCTLFRFIIYPGKEEMGQGRDKLGAWD